MTLYFQGEPLPAGADAILGDIVWSYASLLQMTDAERAMLGVTQTPPPPPSAAELCAWVDDERDRRIDGGFTFAGHSFQSRASDRENVMGAAQLAMAAIGQGAQPGDLRWADPARDFVWITADNQLVPLDAFAAVALFQAGIAFKTALTFHARELKDALLAAADPATVEIVDGWPA